MGKVIIKREEDTGWVSPKGMPQVAQRFIFEGVHGVPEVFIVRREPGFVGPVHSHTQDEIIYILDGDVTVGDTHCPKGTALFIEKDTMYGPLKSGQNGTTFLNIRQVKAGTRVRAA